MERNKEALPFYDYRNRKDRDATWMDCRDIHGFFLAVFITMVGVLAVSWAIGATDNRINKVEEQIHNAE
jgi:hypothetical protein